MYLDRRDLGQLPRDLYCALGMRSNKHSLGGAKPVHTGWASRFLFNFLGLHIENGGGWPNT